MGLRSAIRGLIISKQVKRDIDALPEYLSYLGLITVQLIQIERDILHKVRFLKDSPHVSAQKWDLKRLIQQRKDLLEYAQEVLGDAAKETYDTGGY